MTKHNAPRIPKARVYHLSNIGPVVNVETGSYTFIGHLNGWVEPRDRSFLGTDGTYPIMSISKIEVYAVDRNGMEQFQGYASDRVRGLLTAPMLAAAERCRNNGDFVKAPTYRPAPSGQTNQVYWPKVSQ